LEHGVAAQILTLAKIKPEARGLVFGAYKQLKVLFATDLNQQQGALFLLFQRFYGPRGGSLRDILQVQLKEFVWRELDIFVQLTTLDLHGFLGTVEDADLQTEFVDDIGPHGFQS
jgi:hypothetical protein